MPEPKHPTDYRLYVVVAMVSLLGGGSGNLMSDTLSPSKPHLTPAQIEQIAVAVRPDPFTGKDARALQQDLAGRIMDAKQHTIGVLMNHVCNQIRLLRAEMPPEQTRDRVLALEAELRKLSKSFSPPATGWGRLGPPCTGVSL
jgi:hypothetical protein